MKNVGLKRSLIWEPLKHMRKEECCDHGHNGLSEKTMNDVVIRGYADLIRRMKIMMKVLPKVFDNKVIAISFL